MDNNDYEIVPAEPTPMDDEEQINAEEEYRSVASSDSEQDYAWFEEWEAKGDNLFQDNEDDEQPRKEQKVVEPYKGQTWDTVHELRKYLKNYAIETHFEYKLKPNDIDRVKAKCRGDNCFWMLYASSSRAKKGDSVTMKLSKLRGEHSEECRSNLDMMNRHADSDWVCDKMTEFMKTHHKIFRPRNMHDYCWREHGVLITYYVAWYAREKIMERIHGNYERSYALTPACCEQVLLKNPGSIAKVGNDAADGMYKGMLIAFKVSIQGWLAGCRPILGLDGCHLRGKYGGVCLSIVSLDANNGLYPVAIYLTRKENYQNWFDFLEQLKPHLELHPKKLTFMSDAQKGLDGVLQALFPNANHRLCFRHMYKNFKKDMKAGNALEALSWGMARAYRKSSCEHFKKDLEKAKKEALEWYTARDLKQFCRSEFDHTSVCEHITNNWSESFNNFINELRDKTVTGFVEHYCLLLLTHYRRRLLKAKQMKPDDVVPRVWVTIEKHKKKIHDFILRPASDTRFTLEGDNGYRWEVDLIAKTCECQQWQLSGIPCPHAVSVLIQRRLSIPSFCHDYLKVEAYLRSYDFSVFAIPNDREWNEPTYVVNPPPLERPTGRPRGKRRRGEDEPERTTNKVRRCSICRSTKHTKATCKGLSVAEIKARGGKVKSRPKGHGKQMKTIQEKKSEGVVVSQRGKGTRKPKGSAAGRGQNSVAGRGSTSVRGRGRGSASGRGRGRRSAVGNAQVEPSPSNYNSFEEFNAAFGSQVDTQ